MEKSPSEMGSNKEAIIQEIETLGFTETEVAEMIASYRTLGGGEFQHLEVKGHHIDFRKTAGEHVFVDAQIVTPEKESALRAKYQPVVDLLEKYKNVVSPPTTEIGNNLL